LRDLSIGITTFGFAPALNRDTVRLPSNITMTRRYGAEGRITASTVSPAVEGLRSYFYDSEGRLADRSISGEVAGETFVYDAKGQLIASPGEIYTYDKVGNPADDHAVVELGNRLTAFRGYQLQYDADGNMTRKVGAGIDQYLFWNALSQLDSVRTNGTVTRFGYDGLGRRVRRSRGAGNIRYLYWGAG
jgi:YD repeat-containing protein